MKPGKFLFVFITLFVMSFNTFAEVQIHHVEVLEDEAYLEMELPTLPNEETYYADMAIERMETKRPIEEIALANSIPREIEEQQAWNFRN